MFTDARHYRVRLEQNQALLNEAAFERWLSKALPPAPEREPIWARVARWLGAWMVSWQETVRCTDTAPACGLQMAA